MVMRPKITSSPRFGNERGGVDVFMLMLLSLLVAFAAFAFDMGMVFNTHREATNAAATAARAAADEVDTDALYNDGVARIDEGRARDRADAVLPPGAVRTGWEFAPEEIEVTVQMTHDTVLLQVLGYDSFTVSGEATARVQNGKG